MPVFDPVSTPGGYVHYVHTFPAMARRKQNPLASGESIATQHGYEHKRELLVRFCSRDEIETVVQSCETDGFVRDGAPRVEYEAGPELALYKVTCNFIKYTASPT